MCLIRRIIKKILEKVFIFIGKDVYYAKTMSQHITGIDIIYNVNNTNYEKNCLLIYIVAPFLQNKISYMHQNFWQAKEFARIIGTYEYNVDVAEYSNPYVKPKNMYDMVIGLIPRGIDYYTNALKPNAIRIAYLTSPNISHNKLDVKERINYFNERHGFNMSVPRYDAIYDQYIERKIEHFDAAFFIGNETNFRTYDEFKMPPHSLITNHAHMFRNEISHANRSSKNFLFMGSWGQLEKGLDLLLEIFCKENYPYDLYICSGYELEKDFCNFYYKELFETKNIHPCGYIEIGSDKYYSVLEKCGYLLFPSADEGMAGSVLSAMAGGVIPIVSKRSGYDSQDVILLDDCKIETIMKYVDFYANKSKTEMIKLSNHYFNIYKDKYQEKNFTESVIVAFDSVFNRRMQ